jgi:hypothetical protein
LALVCRVSKLFVENLLNLRPWNDVSALAEKEFFGAEFFYGVAELAAPWLKRVERLW